MLVEIMAHRGVWSSLKEQNTLLSFERAFLNNWGIEFDVRDSQGTLVVSHDMPTGIEPSLDSVFDLYKKIGRDVTLAINIKSDGLADVLKKMLIQKNISRYFVFDMSLPETVRYYRAEMVIFMRRSEFENYSNSKITTSGVWLDNFGEFNDFENALTEYLDNNFPVALVSPELHKRGFLDEWVKWKKIMKKYRENATIFICTDYPDKAFNFFKD